MQVQLAQELIATSAGTRAEEILRRCVHCGFCNATCPTFNLLGDELDGPRGRIYLIKGMFETNEVDEAARHHLDRCLTCRNCETTCPSGVEYGELVELGRNFIEESKPQSSLFETFLLLIVPHFRRLRWLVRVGRLFQWILAPSLRRLLQPLKSVVLNVEPVLGETKVTLLQGCVQRAMTPDVVAHLADLLRKQGIQVIVHDDEICCGGLHLHMGREEAAKQFMTTYLETLYDEEVDAYISTASGCGVTVKDYGRLVGESRAEQLAARTLDASEFLSDFSFKPHPNVKRVALHNPCTLQHGQRVHGLIEQILERAGYEILPVRDSHLCCGSAGSYSLLQPALSEQLLQRKVAALEESAPDVIATSNIGCQLHLAAGANVRVVHWLTLLN